jgi:hypothetical protein
MRESGAWAVMDQDTVLQGLAATAGVLATWVYSTLNRRIALLEKECKSTHERINANEVLMVSQYVRTDRLDRLENAIFHKIDRLEDKFDGRFDALINKLEDHED